MARANKGLLAAALVLTIVAAYASALRGEFLWDDDLHVTANPTIVGPLGLTEIWTTARANYFPLVLTNFWAQHALWGLNPVGYHIVTLACHAIAALLLWRVLLALRVPGAWLGAALWALHPVQVESVAWICELKNTQSAVFFLLAVLWFIEWLRRDAAEGRRFYGLALAAALCALLSKPSTVMLPLALALCAGWLRGRVAWRDLVALAPFCALSAVAAGWTIWEQKHHSGAIGPEWSQTLPERLAIAGRAVWFYLGKLVWPEPLIFIYPRWQIDATRPLAFLGVAAALVGAAGLWLGRRAGAARAALFAGGYFVALLFPVLGFFSVYFFRYSFVGDHFQYLASMGPLALLGAALYRTGGHAPRLLAPALLIALALVTARQSRAYLSSTALWRDTLAKNPIATMAWLNLADTHARASRYDESALAYRRALQLAPRDPDPWNDLGNVLVLTGRPEEALPYFERALALKPDLAAAHGNLGNALRALGRSADAIAHYRRALELKPDDAETQNNLGAELAEQGRPEEAVALFERALRANPRHAAAHDNLGSELRVLGRFDAAIAEHREALRLNADFAEAHANLGRTLAVAGRPAEALPHFERALQLKPGLAIARANFAAALTAVGRPADALAQLERGAELAPRSAEAQHNLGAALARAGRLDEAIARFTTAVELAPRFALARVSLATALGSQSRWAEAIPQLRAALAIDPANATAHAQLAVALVNTGQLEAAVPVFENALRLEPRSVELHSNFAQLLSALGRKREAFEHLEKAADLQRAQKP